VSEIANRRVAVGGFHARDQHLSAAADELCRFRRGGGSDAVDARAGNSRAVSRHEYVRSPARSRCCARRSSCRCRLVWTSTTPAGYVTEDAYERIAAMLIADLRAALPVHAVPISACTGAMVAEHIEDPEGELLRRIRAVIGPDVPVIASLDLHSNTTPEMAALSDGLVGYTTYPHVDMAETGAKAAKLLVETLRQGRKPAKAFRQIPYLIPLTWQCTTTEPSRSIYAAMAEMQRGKVASASFTPGFPAADIWHCGPAVMAYGWEEGAVERAADELARLVLAGREALCRHALSPR